VKPETRFAGRQCLPVVVGYLFFGMAFGLMLQDIGYGYLWALLASSLVYAGSMQFILVGMLAGGMNLAPVALMTLIINSRHVFYGLPFLKTFREMGKAYGYMIFSLTDETYALLCSVKVPGHLDRNRVFWRIALINQCSWIAGSVLGAAGGELANADLTGIDFTMTALFTVIFIEQWLAAGSSNRLPAVIGLLSGVASLLIFGPDRFILPAMILAAGLLIVLRPVLLDGQGRTSDEHP